MKKDNTSQISSEARSLSKLVGQKKFPEAIKKATNILEVYEDIPSDIYRFKSMAESAIGEYSQAIKTLESSLNDSSNEADWHLTAEYCLEFGNNFKAIDYLTKAIDISLAKEETYLLNTCYLERAYAYITIGDHERAFKDLAYLDNDDSVSWLRGVKPITKHNLLELLNKEN